MSAPDYTTWETVDLEVERYELDEAITLTHTSDRTVIEKLYDQWNALNAELADRRYAAENGDTK
jgi:hypothetical protein